MTATITHTSPCTRDSPMKASQLPRITITDAPVTLMDTPSNCVVVFSL